MRLLVAECAPCPFGEGRWGSPEWIAACNRRGGVGASHGNLKSNSGESFQRGQIRLVRMVRTSLMAAFAAVHHNLRMLTEWAKETGQAALDPDPQDRTKPG